MSNIEIRCKEVRSWKRSGYFLVACLAYMILLPLESTHIYASNDQPAKGMSTEKKREFARFRKAVQKAAQATSIKVYFLGGPEWKWVSQGELGAEQVREAAAELRRLQETSWGLSNCPFYIRMDFHRGTKVQKVYVSVDKCRQFYIQGIDYVGTFDEDGVFGRAVESYFYAYGESAKDIGKQTTE